MLLLKAYNVYSIRTGRASVIFQIFANCMAYGNSCLNPILYAFFSTNYRQAFWSIICCGRRSNPAHIHVNGNCEMEYQTGKPTFHKSPPIVNVDGENATLGNRNEDTNGGIELHPLLKDGQVLIISTWHLTLPYKIELFKWGYIFVHLYQQLLTSTRGQKFRISR